MARRSPVPDWVPPDLPAGPGVYRFRTEDGATLYVGKSVNLKRRVRGYFYGSGPPEPRLAEMLRLARGVSVERAGSDLEARLVETDRILRERPPYNKALKRRWRGWYIELRWGEPFPKLRIVRTPRRAGSRYFGPFYGRRLPGRVTRLVEKICRLRTCTDPIRPDRDATPCLQHGLGLCTAPCARLVRLDDYREHVRLAERLLDDRRFALSMRRKEVDAREEAVARLDYEAAAVHQTRIEWLEELEEHRFAFEGDASGGSWLAVLPGARPGARVLQPVARGRVLSRLGADLGDGDWQASIRDACYAVRVGELSASSVSSPEELVPSMLIARWIEEGSPGGRCFDLDRLDADAIIDLIALELDALPIPA